MPTLPVNGYDIAFVEHGEGVPLVLVHGTLGDWRSWAGQMEPFGAHYRTIAVSLRRCWPERWDGEGDDFTVQQHTKDVAAFVAALDAGPVHLMGHSRGGHIAFRVTQHFPDLVRKLVLVEPGGALDASLEPPQAPTSPPIALGPLYAAAAERIRRGEIDEGLAYSELSNCRRFVARLLKRVNIMAVIARSREAATRRSRGRRAHYDLWIAMLCSR